MAAAITSITGLQNLINLEEFVADYNSLTTIDLSGLTNLIYVDISDNDIPGIGDPSLTSVNLTGCTALQELRLDDSDFSAGIPDLVGLSSLIFFDMDQCNISGDIDLSQLSSTLTGFDLSGNTGITSVSLLEAYLNDVDLYDTALTEASVNDILQWLDGSGVTNGYVDLSGGTSSGPTGAGITAYDNLIGKAWSVNVNSSPTTTTTTTTEPPIPFISVWRTTTPNESVTLPYSSFGTYDGIIDWGDGNTSFNSFANREHAYTTAGDYTITITGTINDWSFGNYSDSTNAAKIISVSQWGNLLLGGNTNSNFRDCSNLDLSTVTDVLNLTDRDYFLQTFLGCTSLTTVNRMNEWDISNITNITNMFSGCILFNQDIGNWDVSNVYNISGMFSGAAAFNQDISNWDMSSITNMSYMFGNATSFNQDISNWDVSNVTNMSGMFYGATSFNQDISNWNFLNVTDMSEMFRDSLYNQDISNWDVSNVTNMRYMFANSPFNQDISNWDVSNVTNMTLMFFLNTSFNQDLSGWCVTNIPTEPSNFALGATSWVLPKPVWGTCPPLTTTTTTSFIPPGAIQFPIIIGYETISPVENIVVSNTLEDACTLFTNETNNNVNYSSQIFDYTTYYLDEETMMLYNSVTNTFAEDGYYLTEGVLQVIDGLGEYIDLNDVCEITTTTTTIEPTTTTTTEEPTTTTTTETPTTTTTTAGPIVCNSYLNNNDTLTGINYTLCDGTVVVNDSIVDGESICIQEGTLSGPGSETMTNEGVC
jgi:surface protein